MIVRFKEILGIRFFTGDLEGLFTIVSAGGLIVVPSAPVLVELSKSPAHREALLGSDFALTDSGFLVILWLLLKQENLPRISGLRFLRGLLNREELRQSGTTFWVMPTEGDEKANRVWLLTQGLVLADADCYVAPVYGAGRLEDPALLSFVERKRPNYVFLNLGGGVQERLGYYLRKNLSYCPAIICTGAAIAFLSGRQARIPAWADRLMLGWLVRILHSPARFFPRYWRSLSLIRLIAETTGPGN